MGILASGVYHSPHFVPGSYYVKFEGGDRYDALVHPAAVAVAAAVTGIDLRLPQTIGRITGVLRPLESGPYVAGRNAGPTLSRPTV